MVGIVLYQFAASPLQREGALVRALYRASFPLVGLVMRRSMQITGENAERACERTRQALDFVAKQAAATG